jgi:hypothetical protein
MERHEHDEGIFARGVRDAKHGLHSPLFWAFEACGGMVALFDPVTGALWAFGGIAMLWLGATAGAPFRQRTEWRNLLLEKIDAEEWINMEAAGRLHRDTLVEFGMTEGVKAFDSLTTTWLQVPNAVAFAYSYFAAEGINDGVLEVNADTYTKLIDSNEEFLCMDGTYYRQLRVKRSTVKSYVERIRRHDAELKERAKTAKDQRIREGSRDGPGGGR